MLMPNILIQERSLFHSKENNVTVRGSSRERDLLKISLGGPFNSVPMADTNQYTRPSSPVSNNGERKCCSLLGKLVGLIFPRRTI